ncbi:MAG TPA: glutaminase A [Methylibium sp.]|nr:glutaminase A [Methylibium sp.]
MPPTPAGSPIQAYLERLHAEFKDDASGAVASYIPELLKADPAWFGIAIATVDGRVYEVGQSRQAFTIQSISKPLVYGMALEDRGMDRVLQAIAVEPSGDAFNSISLEAGSGRPLNPMINAGAIAAASLVAGDGAAARLERVLGALSAYAGRPLAIDQAVFESERDTGHRNRAIGHMLRNYGIVESDPEPSLDLYFNQCSVLVDCRDLALVAATLANGGVNPVTQARAVRTEFVSPILSVMTTCGMYDFAGTWAYRVGLPAKSGVGGGIIAVLPGQLGIGVFSPPLDARGNSVRGVQVCERLSRDLGLHFLQPPRPSAATVRARYTLAGVRSKRRRTPAESRVLDAHGHEAVAFELQGDLRFPTIEPVLREVSEAGESLRYAVLDFKRVTHVDPAALRMFAGLVHCCARRGQHLVLTRVRRDGLMAGFEAELDPHDARSVSFQPQLDAGLEWCERSLLATHGAAHGLTPMAGLGLAEHRLCEDVDAEGIAHLEALAEHREYEAGSPIVRRGDAADAVYFLMRGEVSVVVELPQGGQKRLSTLSAGMCFGEAALQQRGQRSADVRADTLVACRVLYTRDFEALERERPALAIRLLHNLLRSTAETAVRLTADVAALEG